MNDDILHELGALAFASRLKRLSEALQRDVSRIYREQDIDFEARWFPVAYLLSRKASLAVTEISTGLGLTHPAVNQIAGQMTRAGLLESRHDSRDERRRLLKLSRRGKSIVKKLQPLWQAIEESTRELIEKTSPALLDHITDIERALGDRNMYQRVNEKLKANKNRN